MAHSHERYEITETDILSLENVTSSQLSVFGVSLGMTFDEASRKIQRYSFLGLGKPQGQEFWVVSEKRTGGGLISFTWRQEGGGLAEIRLQNTMAKYMVGESKRLLAVEAFVANTGPVKTFLGSPDRTDSKDLLDTTHFYIGKGIAIEAHHSLEYLKKKIKKADLPPPTSADIWWVSVILTR